MKYLTFISLSVCLGVCSVSTNILASSSEAIDLPVLKSCVPPSTVLKKEESCVAKKTDYLRDTSIEDYCAKQMPEIDKVKVDSKSSKPQIKQLFKCGDELKNCFCELMGDGACDNLIASSEVVPQSLPESKLDKQKGAARYEKTHIVINDQGKAEIRLSDKDAQMLARAQDWSKHKSISDISLYYNRNLTKLALALLYVDIWNNGINALHNTDNTTPLNDTALWTKEYDRPWIVGSESKASKSLDDSAKNDDGSYALSVQINLINKNFSFALQSCELQKTADGLNSLMNFNGEMRLNFMEASIRSYSNISKSDYNENLVCLMRYKTDDPFLQSWATLPKWDECPCIDQFHKPNGINLNGVCIKNQFTPIPFEEQPIDQRMPHVMGCLIDKLNSDPSLKGLKVKEIGLSGCSFPRFETGGDMKYGILHTKKINLDHLSEHANGTACDLRSISFFDENTCNMRSFDMLAEVPGLDKFNNPKKDTLFDKALTKFVNTLGKEHDIVMPITGEGVNRKASKDGIGGFWQKVEDATADFEPPASMNENEWYQVKLGSRVRNSFVDCGAEVTDNTMGSEHENHFHISLPKDQNTWNVLSSIGTNTTKKQKNSVIEERLQRNAGVYFPPPKPKRRR